MTDRTATNKGRFRMLRCVSISRVALIALLLTAASPASFPQQPPPRTQAQEDIARIVGYAMTRGGALDFLETLSDRIPGRITGTPEDRAAAELILRTLKEAGFDSAHFEEYALSSQWRHGTATGEVISPVHSSLIIGSYGWVPGTPGPIEVPVVDFGPPGDGNAPIAANVRGGAVVVDLRSNGSSSTYVGARAIIARRLAQAGAAAMFIVSDKPDRMVYTSAFGFYPHAPLPVISIASEDAAFLRRLLANGEVKIRLDVRNSFPGPGTERNVVADLQGSDSKEMVVLCAHFDDWDPAQGANDNGAGVAVVLEGARILKLLGIRPKHTIRFVFFSGEEELSNGSRAYVEQHKNELDNIRAVFNIDSGAHPPLGFAIHGRQDTEAISKKLLSPLAPLGAERVFLDADFDSDQETFIVAGVPIYSLRVDPQDYDTRHHTIIDTFERVDPHMLALQTAVMAVAGYSFANAEQRPGRRLSPAEVQELLKRTGLQQLYELEYSAEKPH
jgi:carboxypeptidase Q